MKIIWLDITRYLYVGRYLYIVEKSIIPTISY